MIYAHCGWWTGYGGVWWGVRLNELDKDRTSVVAASLKRAGDKLYMMARSARTGLSGLRGVGWGGGGQDMSLEWPPHSTLELTATICVVFNLV